TAFVSMRQRDAARREVDAIAAHQPRTRGIELDRMLEQPARVVPFGIAAIRSAAKELEAQDHRGRASHEGDLTGAVPRRVYWGGGREAGVHRGWPDLDARGICCSGGREASANRGWPELDARGICCSGGREAGVHRGWPELDARGICCSGGREAGAHRGWPELDARGICCSGGREAGVHRGWPELDARGSAPHVEYARAARQRQA